MQLTITAVDEGPEELQEQTPIVVDLIREMPAKDRPDYWLGVTRRPLRWVVDGEEHVINHVVVSSRFSLHGIQPGACCLVIGIGYVTDSSLLADRILQFEKCAYVAIGVCNVEAAPTQAAA